MGAGRQEDEAFAAWLAQHLAALRRVARAFAEPADQHDLLQELKTHRLIRKIMRGGERVGWGAKTIPEGGFLSLPRRLNAPGLLICGDGAGLVNVPALKVMVPGVAAEPSPQSIIAE